MLEGVILLPIKYVTAEVRNLLCCYKNLCEHIIFSPSPTLLCIARILTMNVSTTAWELTVGTGDGMGKGGQGGGKSGQL